MYVYRGGWGDPYSTSTADSDDRVVDLAKFDSEETVAVLRGAPETLRSSATDITERWIDIEPSKDPATPDAVNVQIYVSSEFGSGFIILAARRHRQADQLSGLSAASGRDGPIWRRIYRRDTIVRGVGLS